MIWYAVEFLLFSLAFWFRSFASAGWLSNNFIKFSRRPDSIFSGVLRKTLMTFIPMAMIASVPARFLIYGPSSGWDLLIIQILICISFFILSRYIWLRSLLKYESASS